MVATGQNAASRHMVALFKDGFAIRGFRAISDEPEKFISVGLMLLTNMANGVARDLFTNNGKIEFQ